jgi:DNA-binding NtrC family response regulator
VEVFRDMSQIAELKRRLGGRHRLADIVGKSPLMQQIFELLPLVAASDATALIAGPSGTGKELIARTIHSIGPRCKGPFVAVNCAAIPEALLESELFGHVKGAFTDARQARPGRIAAAEAGTLLLDEIGDLPRPMQVKVLRFLQDREYSPVGSDRTQRANVRIVAATNRDLLAMVRTGHFREDLYFRLNVVQIDIPPLARRTEDIPLLVQHYIKVFRESTGKAIEDIDDDAMAMLMAYSFPGNVRELENIVERGFILCQGGRLTRAHLPPSVLAGASSLVGALPGGRQGMMEAAIRLALQQTGGNRTRAAAQLGVHRITLLRRMQRLGIV